MVKGIARRVIVVKSPKSRFFEQAIFIVREQAFHSDNGVTAEDILQQAQETADGYVRQHTVWARRFRHITPPIYMAIGGLTASLAWGIGLLFW